MNDAGDHTTRGIRTASSYCKGFLISQLRLTVSMPLSKKTLSLSRSAIDDVPTALTILHVYDVVALIAMDLVVEPRWTLSAWVNQRPSRSSYDRGRQYLILEASYAENGSGLSFEISEVTGILNRRGCTIYALMARSGSKVHLASWMARLDTILRL
jgi:hypothetical protein